MLYDIQINKVMLLEEFQRYIKENYLIEPGERVLLAVSGGVDSMVMLSLFARSGYDVAVAHCNFQLRGEESVEDEQLVEDQCASLGVEFYNKRFDTVGEMDRSGDSVQMAARRLRYDWFNSICEEYGYDAVAIAHHADDSIETFFINLFRGTGLKGLTGIHKVRGRVVRPILFASRKDIADYAHQYNIPFREDSSNRSTKYLRNKIRLGLVPKLREINPKFTELMSDNIRRLTATQLFIDRSIELIRDRIESRQGDLTLIDLDSIDQEYPIGFVLFELLNPYGFKGDVVDQLTRSLHNDATGKRFYGKDKVAYVDRGRIIVADISGEESCQVEIDKESRKAYIGNSALYFERTDIDNIDTLNVPENVALLDADLLKFPLTARRWNDGDRFIPLGMTGRKKVSDFLVDAKVSAAQKARQFVLLSGEDIVWLVGRRIDDAYRVSDKTENILKITREVL